MAVTETSPGPAKGVRPKRRSGVVVPHAPTWYQRLAAWILVILAKALAASLRYRWQDKSGLTRPDAPVGPVIFAIWHNRVGLTMQAYTYSRKFRKCRMAALVSASKDGGFLAAILEYFGIQPVRGSSSRRGPRALLELITWAERGYDLTITPDGPRGPCYQVQDGIVYLAQITGLPVVPFSFHAHSKIQVKSWDRFQIPLPFSRCDMVLGKPMSLPKELTDTAREEFRLQLENELKRLSID